MSNQNTTEYEPEAGQEDYSPDLVTLVDEDGIESEYEIVDAIELDGDERYMALVPIAESPEDLLDESGDLLIFRIVTENDEDIFETIEDEDEYERISAIFVERLSDRYDIEEGE
jgi:uncharacterized protein YrzB (UPF0473 family)